MQNFNETSSFLNSVTFTYNTIRPQLPDESTTNQENESSLSFETSYQSPSKELQKKLKSINRRRKDQLQNATDFMDSMRRIEKKRSRKKITDISLLNSA